MENRPLKERMMEYEGATKYQFPSDSVNWNNCPLTR